MAGIGCPRASDHHARPRTLVHRHSAEAEHLRKHQFVIICPIDIAWAWDRL